MVTRSLRKTSLSYATDKRLWEDLHLTAAEKDITITNFLKYWVGPKVCMVFFCKINWIRQYEVRLLVSIYTRNIKIRVEGNRFLLIGFPVWKAGSILLWTLLFCKTQNVLCSQKDCKPKLCPKVPHYCLSVLLWSFSQPCKKVSIISVVCTCGF